MGIHAHAYRKHPPFVVQFCTAEQVLERYDEAGIEKGALLPVVSPEIYLPQSNEDILEMAEQYADYRNYAMATGVAVPGTTERRARNRAKTTRRTARLLLHVLC